MSIIKTYRKEKFAQINLDDGNKILISDGATDIRIFKIGFLNLPKGTLHIFSSKFAHELTQKIGYDLSKDVVKIIADELVKAGSLEETKEICTRLEHNKEFLDAI